jgi:L-ribulokinase
LPEFAQEPHAYVKLWKHHAAQSQADRMTRVALERGEEWLAVYGGVVSCEWSMPKLWQVLEEAPRVCEAMDVWIEAGDWIVWQLCGTPVQSACSAGFKSFYRQREGYPQADYFAALDPELERLVSRTCRVPVAPVCSKAGGLSDEMAGKLGLCPGTAVSVSMVDAHAGMLAVGITGPGHMGAILGTSACFMALDDRLCPVPGISGAVEGGILPGCWGYEQGQSCVGDGFAWFADNCVPEHYAVKAREQGLSVQQHLTAQAFSGRAGYFGMCRYFQAAQVFSDFTGIVSMHRLFRTAQALSGCAGTLMGEHRFYISIRNCRDLSDQQRKEPCFG